jgi:hypothetical protein
MKQYIFTALITLGLTSAATAHENIGTGRYSGPQEGNQVYSGCAPSKSRADLDVNNVRTPIYINGDMWWDLVGTAIYEVPVGSGKNSMFAGAIWVGGKDAGSNNLKVAAQTYRQSGNDFWPGPVDNTMSVTPDVCLKYDKHFKVTFAEVKNFHLNYQVNGDVTYPIPLSVKNWPGNNYDQGYEFQLAPFHDESNDGVYDYNDGDYPKYNVDGTLDQCDKSLLLGDQTIWWVFNDVGNIHTETSSQFAVGLEIQAQAFGFNTNDEINNMTFYRYKIINRASNQLNETYFGAWVDPDLGNYLDDYVGCDVARGLGYCYNGDADDDGAVGYGLNPPAIGMDFFEGPLADPGDLLDNDRDSEVDEVGEQIIMSKFVYYNNDFTNIGNPVTANHYYNYLRGIWKDGSPLVYGGTGYQTSAPGGTPCNFMFPGDTDPLNIGTNGVPQQWQWTERQPLPTGNANEPSDRRFLQSAGAFTLQPGAVNYITTGVVWARTSSGGPDQSVKLLKLADVKAQNLFESCFQVSNGPDAPVVKIRELDRELILSLENPFSSNNFRELYTEKDINIPSSPDAIFKFEGYKIFQVKDASVSVTELENADRARLIVQCDIKNGIAQIVNSVFDGNLNDCVPTEKVNGSDNGLKHTFRITTDAFATGDAVLINHKTYYFMAIAYAFDSLANQSACNPPLTPPGVYGQPYIQSRKNADGSAISVYTAIPHISAPESNGLQLTSYFGDGPEITRVTGMGNGYNLGSDRLVMDIKQEQINEVLFNSSNPQNRISALTYKRAQGPVDIRIYDAVKVPPADFALWLTDTTAGGGRWVLKNLTTGRVDSSEKTIMDPYDQLFPDYGFYISINQIVNTGESLAAGNGFINSSVEYSDANQRWLSGISDNDNQFSQKFDWIVAGDDGANFPLQDDYKFYQDVIGGTWAPFRITNHDASGDRVAPAPLYTPLARNYDKMQWLHGVDIVFTKDQSKWSRCVVFETQSDSNIAENRTPKNLIRRSPSRDINGVANQPDSGFSWFPGYAVDVETGERLNIAFGEDSYLTNYGQATGDMIWNPSSTVTASDGRVIAGGKHYIYVFGNKAANNETVTGSNSVDGLTHAPTDTAYWGGAYDGCAHIHYNLWPIRSVSSTLNKRKITTIWKDCMWVGVPLLNPGQILQSNDVKLRIRIAKPFRKYDTGIPSPVANNDFPYYTFSTNDLIAKVNQTEVAKTALDLINVVPNPYYAYSNYETNQLDNRIKITNLPNKCTVSIYTLGGTLIRQFKRDVGFDNSAGATTKEVNLETSQDWDLKNALNIPVASGMYLIHVSAEGIGERTLKWFGVMRPIDLDSF